MMCLFPGCRVRISRQQVMTNLRFCPRQCLLPYCSEEHYRLDVEAGWHTPVCRSVSANVADHVEVADFSGPPWRQGLGLKARRAFQYGEVIFSEDTLVSCLSGVVLEQSRQIFKPEFDQQFLRAMGVPLPTDDQPKTPESFHLPPTGAVNDLYDHFIAEVCCNSPERFFKIMAYFPLDVVKSDATKTTVHNLHLRRNLNPFHQMLSWELFRNLPLVPEEVTQFDQAYYRQADREGRHHPIHSGERHCSRVTLDFLDFLLSEFRMPGHFHCVACSQSDCPSCRPIRARFSILDPTHLQFVDSQGTIFCPLVLPATLIRNLFKIYVMCSACHIYSTFTSMSTMMSMFQLSNLLNHSCTSNCWRTMVGRKLIVYARGRIAVGDQLTVSYEESDMSLELTTRQQLMLERHRFFCHCDLCRDQSSHSPPRNLHIHRSLEDTFFTENTFFYCSARYLRNLPDLTLEETRRRFELIHRANLMASHYLQTHQGKFVLSDLPSDQSLNHDLAIVMDQVIKASNSHDLVFSRHDQGRFSTERQHMRFLRSIERSWEELMARLLFEPSRWQNDPLQPEKVQRWNRLTPLLAQVLLDTAYLCPSQSPFGSLRSSREVSRPLLPDPLQPARMTFLRFLRCRFDPSRAAEMKRLVQTFHQTMEPFCPPGFTVHQLLTIEAAFSSAFRQLWVVHRITYPDQSKILDSSSVES